MPPNRSMPGALTRSSPAFFRTAAASTYCTYLGGSGDDRAFGLAIDSARSVYVTGWTSSTNFPLASAFQTHLSGTRDAFVTKLNAAGNALDYSTYLGGSGVDAGYAIALSSACIKCPYPANSAAVVGDTTSTNLPVTSGVFQPKSGGSQDAFVAMISPAGSKLTFATYLGGSGLDHASSVQVGISGGIFVGGYTWSNNFPVLNPNQPVSGGGGQDRFVVKMGPNGNVLYWSTPILEVSAGPSALPRR